MLPPEKRLKLAPFGPSCLFSAIRRRLHSNLRQNVGNCSSSNLLSEIGQSALNSRVAPAPVLLRHPDHQLPKLLLGPRATDAASLCAPVLLPRDEFPVPGQQALWRHDVRHLFQSSPPNSLGLACQTSSLVVGESCSSLSPLLFQDFDLFLQITDHMILLLVHPARKRDTKMSLNTSTGTLLFMLSEKMKSESREFTDLQPHEHQRFVS